MRTTTFVPMGMPIMAGMLMTAPTLPNIIFWQIANQTYSSAFNYTHMNASSSTTLPETLQSYAMAVGSVLMLTLGLRRAMKPIMRGKEKTAFGKFLNSSVNFGAVATTAALNVYVMRKNELKTGIEVKNALGESMGMSKVAA